MKKLSKINLHNLSSAELSKREENLLRGGNHKCARAGGVRCACAYYGSQANLMDTYYNTSLSDSNFESRFDELVTFVNNVEGTPNTI